VSLFCKGCGIS